MGRKSKAQLEYDVKPTHEKILIQLENMNHSIDRLITTNISTNRDQEKYLKLIAECQVFIVSNLNQNKIAQKWYKQSLKDKLAWCLK